MSQFIFKNRVTSITLNDKDREDINKLVIEYQEKKGIHFENIKELFASLLSDGLCLNSGEVKPMVTESDLPVQTNSEEIKPEIYYTENPRQRTFEFDGHEHTFFECFAPTVENYQKEVVRLRISDIKIVNELLQTRDELEQAKSDLDLINNYDADSVSIPTVNSPENIFIELNENKQLVLKTIAENRYNKGYENSVLSHSELAEKLIFNKATMYNYGGEFYTGLNKNF